MAVARQQRDDAVDRVLHGGRRRFLAGIRPSSQDPRAGAVVVRFGKLQGEDAGSRSTQWRSRRSPSRRVQMRWSWSGHTRHQPRLSGHYGEKPHSFSPKMRFGPPAGPSRCGGGGIRPGLCRSGHRACGGCFGRIRRRRCRQLAKAAWRPADHEGRRLAHGRTAARRLLGGTAVRAAGAGAAAGRTGGTTAGGASAWTGAATGEGASSRAGAQDSVRASACAPAGA